MRHARGVVALVCSLLLGLTLVAAARPDPGPRSDPGARAVSDTLMVAALDTVPDLGKRW